MKPLEDRVPQVNWPTCENEGAKIVPFTVTPRDAEVERMRAAFSFGSRGRGVPEGTYQRLFTASGFGWVLQMSDTPDERADQAWFVLDARGKVLVTGLGLGLTVNALLLKPEVQHVTIIEISPHVIALVEPLLAERHGHDRFTVRQADAMTYKPAKGERYDYIWHDIWPDICEDNKPQYTTLTRRWARRIPNPRNQQAWAKELLFDR